MKVAITAIRIELRAPNQTLSKRDLPLLSVPIQDYEKIRILRGELASDNTPEGAAKRAELEAAVRPFEMHDVSQPWPELLRKGKETIARLSE